MLAHGLTIAGLAWAKRHKREFDRIISIYDPMVRPTKLLRFHENPRPQHLSLRFVDLDTPADPPFNSHVSAKLATKDQVASALAFDRPGDRLLVHCMAGISRSTAIAYAILAQRAGAGREAEAFAALLEVQPDSVPNLVVVGLADELLGRNGAMFQPLHAHEAGRPECSERRVDNREGYHKSFQNPDLRDFM